MPNTITSVAKALTFTAKSSLGGAHTITSQLQFPATEVCVTGTGTPLILNNKTDAGKAELTLNSYGYIQSLDNETALSRYQIKKTVDENNPNYYKLSFKSSGTSPAYNINIAFSTGRDYPFSFLDKNKVYYSINSGEKKLLSSAVKYTLVNNPARTILPAYAGKSTGLTVTIPEVVAVNDIVNVYYAIMEGPEVYENSIDKATITTSSLYFQSNTYTASVTNGNGEAGSVSNSPWESATVQIVPQASKIAQFQSVKRSDDCESEWHGCYTECGWLV